MPDDAPTPGGCLWWCGPHATTWNEKCLWRGCNACQPFCAAAPTVEASATEAAAPTVEASPQPPYPRTPPYPSPPPPYPSPRPLAPPLPALALEQPPPLSGAPTAEASPAHVRGNHHVGASVFLLLVLGSLVNCCCAFTTDRFTRALLRRVFFAKPARSTIMPRPQAPLPRSKARGSNESVPTSPMDAPRDSSWSTSTSHDNDEYEDDDDEDEVVPEYEDDPRDRAAVAARPAPARDGARKGQVGVSA